MPSLFSSPKVKTPKPEKPKPPVGLPEEGEGGITKRRKNLKAGRAGDILSGNLTPRNTGNRTLGNTMNTFQMTQRP